MSCTSMSGEGVEETVVAITNELRGLGPGDGEAADLGRLEVDRSQSYIY
jgi:hypothetical protein